MEPSWATLDCLWHPFEIPLNLLREPFGSSGVNLGSLELLRASISSVGKDLGCVWQYLGRHFSDNNTLLLAKTNTSAHDTTLLKRDAKN